MGLPSAPSFPDIPTPEITAQPPAAAPSGSGGGTGLAGRGAQAGSDVLAALQGLQQGFAQAQMKKFNQLKDASLVAKMQYDAAVSHLKAFADAGIPKNDPRVVAMIDAAKKADAEMTGRLEQLQSMVTGVKPGSKSKVQPGQEDHHGKLSEALGKVFHTVSPIGKALITGQPRPLSPIPEKATPEPAPVPAAPKILGQPPHGMESA